MVSQTTFFVFVVAILEIINLEAIHSTNLEITIAAVLLALVLWTLLGIFLIYNAQSRMKDWFEMEKIAHDNDLMDLLKQQYINIYRPYITNNKLKVNKLKRVQT